MKKVILGGLIGGVALVFLTYVFLITKPKLHNYEQLKTLPRKKEVILRVENHDKVSSMSVKVLQEGKEFLIFEGKPRREVKLTIEPKKLGLKEGKGEVLVELRRFRFLKDTYRIPALIDYTPPTVNIIFAPYAVMNGGSGAVRVSLSEDASLKLKVREREFPFYRSGQNAYFALFALPVDFTPKDTIQIIAVDKAGNTTNVPLPSRLKRKRYPAYRIELKGREKSLIPKLSTLLGEEVSEENFISAFKRVNEEMRRENEEQIESITRNSEETLYWSGRFSQLKRSKVVSVFGEKRVYTYGGRKISESYHWGYDLASVKNAPVEASNDGKVVFTGFIGIYGNTVIVDHGYGLMSIYSHLAEFKVKKGDLVKKGQVIGITDTTGFAFGDHLHYGMTVHGYPVNPIEWWDGRWIKNNVLPALKPSTSNN
ncbi:MAG: M23 family metallopeptidase [Aquificae bacterium]|nr:M23 family metallopeptidase [Aquificota bacterium]